MTFLLVLAQFMKLVHLKQVKLRVMLVLMELLAQRALLVQMVPRALALKARLALREFRARKAQRVLLAGMAPLNELVLQVRKVLPAPLAPKVPLVSQAQMVLQVFQAALVGLAFKAHRGFLVHLVSQAHVDFKALLVFHSRMHIQHRDVSSLLNHRISSDRHVYRIWSRSSTLE